MGIYLLPPLFLWSCQPPHLFHFSVHHFRASHSSLPFFRSYLSPPSFWDVTQRHWAIGAATFRRGIQVSSSREYSPIIPIWAFDTSITQSPNIPTTTKTSTASSRQPNFAHLPTIMHPNSVLPFIQFVAICSIFSRPLSLSLSHFSFLFSISVPYSYNPFLPIYSSLLSIHQFFPPITVYT